MWRRRWNGRESRTCRSCESTVTKTWIGSRISWRCLCVIWSLGVFWAIRRSFLPEGKRMPRRILAQAVVLHLDDGLPVKHGRVLDDIEGGMAGTLACALRKRLAEWTRMVRPEAVFAQAVPP